MAVYPANLPGLTVNVKWTPLWFNQSQKALDGSNIDISFAQWPLHQFELTYELLRDAPGGAYSAINYEWRRLMGFYGEMGGQLGRFGFDNPDDDSVTGQAIATGDGTTTSFQIVRSFGDPTFALWTEPIGVLDLGAGGINVYLNGVAQSSGVTFTITTPLNQLVNFATAPGAGVAITMDFRFFYYCKFVEDSIQFEKFLNGRWQALSVKLLSCRLGA